MYMYMPIYMYMYTNIPPVSETILSRVLAKQKKKQGGEQTN